MNYSRYIMNVNKDWGLFIWFTMIYNVHHNFFEIMAHKESKYVGAIENELINICFCSDCDIIDWKPFSNLAIKLSDEIIVRSDVRIKKVETKILKKVYNLFDHNIIRIFCVYRFFTHNSLGYIVMKYVKCWVIDPLASSELINKIARAAKISRISV